MFRDEPAIPDGPETTRLRALVLATLVLVSLAPGATAGEAPWTADAIQRLRRVSDPQVSPDGRWVAYVSHESGAPEIYVHSFPTAGARARVSTEGGLSPRWSRDGRELFYWAGTPTTRLMSVDIPANDALRPGAPRQVFQQLVGTTWDVTPDRDRFLIELTASREGVRLATVTNWFEELRRRAPTGR